MRIDHEKINDLGDHACRALVSFAAHMLCSRGDRSDLENRILDEFVYFGVITEGDKCQGS